MPKVCLGSCLPYCSYRTSRIILIILVIILSILVIILGMRVYSLTGSRLIPASQARRLIESGDITQIIDIRTRIEYDIGHYPNSIHIPVNEISRETTLGLNKTAGTLVYCNTGQRARYAANKLVDLGFTRVVYIDGTYETIM
jgi:phage shock protein E